MDFSLQPDRDAAAPEVVDSRAVDPPSEPAAAAGAAPAAAAVAEAAEAAPRAGRSLSLRATLVGILLAALLIALTATGLATQALLRGFLTQQVEKELADNALSQTQFAIRESASGLDEPFGRPSLPGGYVVRWWADGVQPQTYPDQAVAPAFPNLKASDVAARTQAFTVGSVSGSGSWLVAARVYQDQRTGNPVYSLVAAPLNRVDEAVRQLRLAVLGFGAVVVAGCAVLGWLAIRRAFVPLRQVEDTAAAIAAGDLSRRVPARHATTEVGRLTASLNGMLSQIESAFKAREASEARTRRFAADASHELRTPLAAIRGFAELYRQGAVPADEVPRTMQRIEDEARRMGGLVEDLLLLARLDEQRPARTEPVDLAVLAGDAVHDARALDPNRAVRLVGLDGAGPAPAIVTGDEDRLRQVVANLLGNAVKHTPPGTPVEVAVGGLDGRAVLEVRDHGQGLSEEQAKRVFERFYRADTSRQRGKGGGAGLGLSIVAAVVGSHAGSVEVLPTPGGGATFRVALPTASSP